MRRNNHDNKDARFAENHKLYMAKLELYKKLGYDVEKNRDYIVNTAKPLKGNILEVGTGKGHLTVALGKMGCRFTSVDYSEDNLDTARLNLRYFKLEDRVKLKKENAENMSFSDNVFDVIITVNTIHELKNPMRVMEELVRVLRPAGKIIISDFTAEGFKIVDKLHQAEGSVHTKKNDRDLKDVKKYFKNEQYIVKDICNKYQQILIISSNMREEDK